MQIIHESLSRVRVGEPTRFANLVMFPLIGDAVDEPDYATLDEALRGGWIQISEVSESGSVPDLELLNRGGRAVFLMDGEELIGAKQNRVLNLSILAPAWKTVTLPVSCVEQGRWAYRTRSFSSSPQAMYSRARAMKTEQVSLSLRASGTRMSDQGRLWADVAQKSQRLGASSPSGAMSDIFEKESDSVDEYIANMRWTEGQTGAVFALAGQLSGLDLFGYPDTMRRLPPKIVRSYALDAIEANEQQEREISRAAVEGLLTEIRESQVVIFPAVCLGQDLRLLSPNLSGGGLAYDGRLLHLSAFRTPEGATRSENTGSRRTGFGQVIRSSLRRMRRSGT